MQQFLNTCAEWGCRRNLGALTVRFLAPGSEVSHVAFRDPEHKKSAGFAEKLSVD
jgi:hypothetical protein